MRTFRRVAAVLVLSLLATSGRAAELSLAGPWNVLLDRGNRGETLGWQTPAFWNSGKDGATVQLPGSIQSQKIGDLPSVDSPWTARIGMNLLKHPKYAAYQERGNFKTPFWLTPERVYVGSAWHYREVTIPETFNGQRVTLTLERPHWETTVWVDGKQAGPPQNSLGTPHVYDLTAVLGDAPAGTHTVVLRVDNRISVPVGLDASAVTDQTQSNWNGVVGAIALATTPKTWIDDVQAYPDMGNKRVRLRMSVRGAGTPGDVEVTGAVRNTANLQKLPSERVRVEWKREGERHTAELTYALGEGAQAWSEFSPVLYDLQVRLRGADQTELHTRTVTFGLREISAKGTQFLLNGKPLYLRGTLECAIFPLTGYPPTGDAPEARAYWTKIYSQMKAFGLNHLRFHSWCPPEIALTVADEMGIYLQIEAGVWAAFGASGAPPVENRAEDAGGQGGAALDTWIVQETDAMLRAYGNHPSFVLMAAANEPGSRTNRPNAEFLSKLVDQWKAKDSRHLYTAGSNWPNVPNAEFQVMSAPRLNAGGRANRPPSTTLTYADVVAQWSMPVVSHESGQWCAYPNFEEIPKYTGALRPGNLQIFADFLGRAGMADQARAFLMASGKWQTALYKEEIEALLRTPNIGGFQLLDLHDFPGQGTAPVGVLDAFWDEKPYVTADLFRRFCGPTVPLAVLPKRVFTAGETLTATVKVSHFGADELPAPRGVLGTTARWRLLDRDRIVRAGELPVGAIPTGAVSDVGTVEIPLRDLDAPAKYTLEVTVRNAVGAVPATPATVPDFIGPTFTNSWDVWVYPPAADIPVAPSPSVRIARALDEDTRKFLDEGGRVLLLPALDKVAGEARSSFTPIFWNRITFTNPNKEHTLSVLCDPAHGAFAKFPTDGHTDWNWHDLLQPTRSKPMVLDGLPATLKPLIQYIDDWDTARRLALAVEATYGENGGKLIICSIDLLTGTAAEEGAPAAAPSPRPVARQLLSSLLHYMATDQFLVSEPTISPEGELIPAPELPALKPEEVRKLIGE